MSLESKAEEYYQEPHCLFNNELRYRSIEVDKDTGKQTNYCLVADKVCPYYKRSGNHDYCMNYSREFK